jgi:hypothetical protein
MERWQRLAMGIGDQGDKRRRQGGYWTETDRGGRERLTGEGGRDGQERQGEMDRGRQRCELSGETRDEREGGIRGYVGVGLEVGRRMSAWECT